MLCQPSRMGSRQQSSVSPQKCRHQHSSHQPRAWQSLLLTHTLARLPPGQQSDTGLLGRLPLAAGACLHGVSRPLPPTPACLEVELAALPRLISLLEPQT